MKLRAYTYYFLLFCLCISVIFINANIGSYGLIHFSVLILFISFLIWGNKETSNLIFRIDLISKRILIFGFIVILSYLFNLKYYYYIQEVYYKTIGNSPPFLYLKICLSGALVLLSSWLSYRTARVVTDGHKRLLGILWTLIIVISINSLVNLVAWLIQTGGVLGRYNFDPPITGTPGISIQLSILGFMLGLPLFKYYYSPRLRMFLRFLLVILFSNVVIIFTRQSQLTFFAILLLFYLLSGKLDIKKILYLFVGLGVVGSVFFYILFASGNLDLYLNINSTDAVDVAIRLTTINSALQIFMANPLLGIGYGMFSGHNATPIFITGVEVYLASPHNGIISILCELGVIGLFIYIYMNVYIIIKLNQIRKKVDDIRLKLVLTSIFSIQAVLSVSILISNSHLYGPPSELTYTCFGFISWALIGACLGISDFQGEK